MAASSRAGHGYLGVLLGLIVLVVPGFLGVAVGTLPDAFPTGWMRYPESWTEGGARALIVGMSVMLLIVARGYYSFWRFGWFGYIVWAVFGIIALITSWNADAETSVIQVFPVLVVLGLPYVWARRGAYGIGSEPCAGIR